MTKEKLIAEIRLSFNHVKLDKGVGLWEGQGLDDHANENEILKFRATDERDNWDAIPYKDLSRCHSSLSFFDAKGMRFHLPKFMILDIIEEEIYEEQGIRSPDIVFALGHNLDKEYQKDRFSLLDRHQVETIIHYLEYKLEIAIAADKEHLTDHDLIELTRILNEWKQKLN